MPGLLQAFSPGALVNPALVGTTFTGRVEGAHSAGYWVTISLGGTEWRGSLLCPPESFFHPLQQQQQPPLPAVVTEGAGHVARVQPPKRPKTAFNYFSEHVRDTAKRQHPTYDQKSEGKGRAFCLCACWEPRSWARSPCELTRKLPHT